MEVKKAILRRYDIAEETYRQRFRAARKGEGETYMELATRLQGLAKKWLAECDSINAVMARVVLEQLLDAMPVDLRVWLCERKPTSPEQAGTLADDYVRARQRRHVDTLRPETQTREPARQDSIYRRCHACGQEGHIAANCPKQPASQSQPMDPELKKDKLEKTKGKVDRKCYNCHQKGHLAKDCPSAFYCEEHNGHKGVVVGGGLGQEGRSMEVMEVRAVVASVGRNDTCGCEGSKQVPGKGEVVGKGDLSVGERSRPVPGKGGLVVGGENQRREEEQNVVGNGLW